jgi:site-specific DNA recombinase
MSGYFAYTRVSTVKQGERGTSLDEQRSAIEAYAGRNGLPITEWFQEMETAAKQGRRQFTRMLGELKKGRASGVIIHKIDRSARNLKDWAQLGDLIDAGVDIRFAHESIDLNSRGGRLSADIQAVVAADFIRNHRQVVRMGFEGRLKQGLYPLPAPRGYRDEGGGKPKTIDPHTGPLVRHAFDLYASGAHTFDTLRREMFARGLRTRAGKPLSLHGVSAMLSNPFYVGAIRIARTGQIFEGTHEPLVAKVTFDRVQAVMSGRTAARIQSHAHGRMIRCEACGYALVGERQKGRTYYRCHTKTCGGTSLREDVIDEAVRKVLSAFDFTDMEFGDVRDIAQQLQDGAAQVRQDHISRIRRDLALCEDRLARLTDALIDGLIEKEAYETRNAGLAVERVALRKSLEAPPEPEPFGERVLKILELGRTAYLGFDLALPDEKREIVQTLTSNFLALRKEVVAKPRKDFEEFINWRQML